MFNHPDFTMSIFPVLNKEHCATFLKNFLGTLSTLDHLVKNTAGVKEFHFVKGL